MNELDDRLKNLERLLYKLDALDEKIRGIQETAYLMLIPGMKESILEGISQPIEECISWEELEWELTSND